MIKSFKHKGLEDFFFKSSKKGIQANHASKLADILDLLDAASEIRDLQFPSLRLHRWLPKSSELWSLDVSGQWRVVFRFIGGDVYEVDYAQSH